MVSVLIFDRCSLGVEKRKRMQFPLGELLAAMRDFRKLQSTIETMPAKLLRMDTDLLKLTSKVEAEYLTVNEYKLLNTY